MSNQEVVTWQECQEWIFRQMDKMGEGTRGAMTVDKAILLYMYCELKEKDAEIVKLREGWNRAAKNWNTDSLAADAQIRSLEAEVKRLHDKYDLQLLVKDRERLSDVACGYLESLQEVSGEIEQVKEILSSERARSKGLREALEKVAEPCPVIEKKHKPCSHDGDDEADIFLESTRRRRDLAREALSLYEEKS